jgi:hypothetical protein
MNSMSEALTEALDHPIIDESRTRARNAHRKGKVARSMDQAAASDPLLWSVLGVIGAVVVLLWRTRRKA